MDSGKSVKFLIETINQETIGPIIISDLKHIIIQDNFTDVDLIDSILILMINNGNLKELSKVKSFSRKIIQLAYPLEYPITEKAIKPTTIKHVISFPPFHQYGLQKLLKNEKNYKTLKDTFIYIIKNSSDYIWICSPFFDYNGIKPLLSFLKLKLRIGVKVSLLIRPDQINEYQKLLENVDMAYHKQITCRSYHYVYNNRIQSGIHSKIFGCDTKLCYTGSGEVRYNSYYKNFETGILLENEEVLFFYDTFNMIFEKSKDIITRG